MKLNPHWIYPKIRNIHRIIPYVLLSGFVGGAYGAVHDQISYTISPEYFTAFKFHQFCYADFALPNRAFASIIGFLATWWVGVIVGWFLARIRFDSDHLETAHRDILRGIATVFACALPAFVLGAVIGYIRAFHFPITTFLGWEKELSGVALQRFVLIGYIHNSGYLEGLVGLILAIMVMKMSVRTQREKIRATRPASESEVPINGA